MENGDKKIKKGIKLLGYGMFGITEVISVSKKDMLHMAHPNGRVCGAKRPKCEAERSHHL